MRRIKTFIVKKKTFYRLIQQEEKRCKVDANNNKRRKGERWTWITREEKVNINNKRKPKKHRVKNWQKNFWRNATRKNFRYKKKTFYRLRWKVDANNKRRKGKYKQQEKTKKRRVKNWQKNFWRNATRKNFHCKKKNFLSFKRKGGRWTRIIREEKVNTNNKRKWKIYNQNQKT